MLALLILNGLVGTRGASIMAVTYDPPRRPAAPVAPAVLGLAHHAGLCLDLAEQPLSPFIKPKE